MGWKYETEMYMHENKVGDGWVAGYMGDSLVKAFLSIRRMKRTSPGRAYRMVIR